MRLHATARDATVADFSHEVGHSCIHCHAIREIGPAQPKNTLAQLMARAFGTLTKESEPARRSKHQLASEARSESKIRARQLRFLKAIQAA